MAMQTEFLTVRAGTAGDAGAVKELASRELGRAPSFSRLREILQRYPSILAFDDSRLCGFVFGVAMSPDIIEMANLLVAEPYRNQGIGGQLIQLFEEGTRRDYRVIIASNSDLWPMTHGPKRSAVLLYQRMGYRTLYSTPDTTLLIKELAGNG